jgi:hypothetical protein
MVTYKLYDRILMHLDPNETLSFMVGSVDSEGV